MIELMSEFDWSDLDARLLQLLVAVVEAGSITGAAQRLGVTQSAVSHLLDKLRAITRDPLFVKSGRGIVATARAESLAAQARELLDTLERFARSGDFEPVRWHTTFTIAANDFQRDLLLPALMARLRVQAPGVALRIIPSDVPSLELLRHEQCQLVISPRPPDGTDILQKRLFEDHYRVFYDPAVRAAPRDRAEYLAAAHATVVYAPRRPLDLDQWLAARGVQRHFAVMVPGFAGLPSFLRGSDLLATAPGRLQSHWLRDLASIEPPLPCPTLPMYMVWHMRHQHDAAHRWLRGELEAVVAGLGDNPASSTHTPSTMRILHTMLRVGDLQRAITFYTDVLGMKLLRTSENPEYRYTLAFLGYGSNPEHAELELTYNWGVTSYEPGTAYGHIALGVPDARAAVEKIRAAGGNVTREAGPVQGGSTVIAFVTDPDGYKIELIERAENAAGAGLR